MKQQIHTFPLWDSIQSKVVCPFCETLEETEESYIQGMFRNVTMDKEFVDHLKDNSFCNSHFSRLMEYRDKLALALLVDQLLSLEIAELSSAIVKNRLASTPRTSIQKFFEKFVSTAPAKVYGDPKVNKCALCQYLKDKESDYMDTLIQLWGENLHFRALYRTSHGFCLYHFYSTLHKAPQILAGKDLDNFLETTFDIQYESMKQLTQELKGFIKKFNYNYSNDPWNNYKDSLTKSILKIQKKKDSK